MAGKEACIHLLTSHWGVLEKRDDLDQGHDSWKTQVRAVGHQRSQHPKYTEDLTEQYDCILKDQPLSVLLMFRVSDETH